MPNGYRYLSKEDLISFLGYLQQKKSPVIPHRLTLTGKPVDPSLSDPGEDAQTLLDVVRGCADPASAYAAAARRLGRVCSAPRAEQDAAGLHWHYREDVTDDLCAAGLSRDESDAYAALISSGEYGRICRGIARGGTGTAKPSRGWHDLSGTSEAMHACALTVGYLPARGLITDRLSYEYSLFRGVKPCTRTAFPLRTAPFSDEEKRFAMENSPRLTPLRVDSSAEVIGGELTVRLSLCLRDANAAGGTHRTISLHGGTVLDFDQLKGTAEPVTLTAETDADGVFRVDLPPVTCLPGPETDVEAAVRSLNSPSAVMKLAGLIISNGLIAADVRMNVQVNTDLTGRGSSNFVYDRTCTLWRQELFLCADGMIPGE